MPIASSTRTSYQEGTSQRIARAKGPDVWVYRWRERQPDGSSKLRAKTIGNVKRYPKLKDAKLAVENLRAEINAPPSAGKITVQEAWGHFEAHELHNEKRRGTGTVKCYLCNFKNWILPRWGGTVLEAVKPVAVEAWLESIDGLADGTKSKVKQQLSCLFSHAIRHELFNPIRHQQDQMKPNPISSVRQGAEPERDSVCFSVDQVRAILGGIERPAIRMMVLVAICTGMRRSEILGLQWSDIDPKGLWFTGRRGVVGKRVTKRKNSESQKPTEMLKALAEALEQWRTETPYPGDTDWVFASPHTGGERPYWPDAVLKDHLRPAAERAGIASKFGWHAFRHSFASIMGETEQVKVVQELLRHSTPRMTMHYMKVNSDAKRSALGNVSGIFAVPGKAG